MTEGERILRICNACRYCEGFCAVFRAMERRQEFLEPDLTYLANLCHDCGECYDACQYAPPHEFQLNLPKTLSAIRRESYRRSAVPRWAARRLATRRGDVKGEALGWLAALVTAERRTLVLSLAALPLLSVLMLIVRVGRPVFEPYPVSEGGFYQVVPHSVMIATFGAAGLGVAIAMMCGAVRFWKATGAGPWRWHAVFQAVRESLVLRYLDGGGTGCSHSPLSRRFFHHFTFYGFILCLAATTVAAVYHNLLGWPAPYPLLSAPVVLGSLGGVGLIVGPIGLLWLKRHRDPEVVDPQHAAMDVAFLVILAATSVSGFLLLALRESAAMGTLLAIHLGIVLGLFFTMPYGKFVHGIYRFAALVRNAMEEEQR
jgi:citrate/tricarballylate utilization protein